MDTALVGGVVLLLNPLASIDVDNAGILSPFGIARPFDKDADGMVRGEGCGSLLLQHEEPGTAGLAGLCGCSVNNDNVALRPSQPDQNAEELVILEALRSADIAGGDIAHTEMHGECLGCICGLIAVSQAWGQELVMLLNSEPFSHR